MKRVFCTLFTILMSSHIVASVQVQISDPNSFDALDLSEIIIGHDPNTHEPITLPEVMVGATVSILVHSDSNDLWSGGLFIEGQDRAFGQLTARDGGPSLRYFDPNSTEAAPDSQYFIRSCLKNAGEYAYILKWRDSNIWGFDCYTDDLERDPGRWFVLDYTALKPGPCTVGFYDHNENDWTITDPNLTILFQNTPTRDLKPDNIVNFGDFVIFAANWNQQSDTNDPNHFSPADFSQDGFVGLEDLIMFADYWLWGAPGWKFNVIKPVVDTPPAEPVVYDVLYSLICDPNASPFNDPNTLSDANSLSEITLQVGDSVTIYIDKASTWEDVKIFDMDVAISDPNLGVMDTDPNGTAQILAYPRMPAFDWFGPADAPHVGIGFFAAHVEPVWDGDMAAFVYTATKAGTVQLDLVDYAPWPGANLKSMVIHQVQPVVEMLQQAYDESTDLQQSVSQEEWNEFIESVEESTQQ